MDPNATFTYGDRTFVIRAVAVDGGFTEAITEVFPFTVDAEWDGSGEVFSNHYVVFAVAAGEIARTVDEDAANGR